MMICQAGFQKYFYNRRTILWSSTTTTFVQKRGKAGFISTRLPRRWTFRSRPLTVGFVRSCPRNWNRKRLQLSSRLERNTKRNSVTEKAPCKAERKIFLFSSAGIQAFAKVFERAVLAACKRQWQLRQWRGVSREIPPDADCFADKTGNALYLFCSSFQMRRKQPNKL